jgi:hypothetical protein
MSLAKPVIAKRHNPIVKVIFFIFRNIDFFGCNFTDNFSIMQEIEGDDLKKCVIFAGVMKYAL